MPNRIVLIVNYNFYDSKRHFTEKLSEAFSRKKIETLIIDTQTIEASTALEIQRFRPDLTCSFNSLDPLPDGKFMWDFLKIPHLSILVDPAIYSVNLTNSPLSILSTVDRSDCDAIKSYKFENIFFWPHAVEKEIEEGHGDRPYDIVFLGSCYDYENLRNYWRSKNNPQYNRALDNAIDLVLSDKQVSLAEAIVTAWNTAQLPTHNTEFTSLFYFLDNYTRGKDRVELIRGIRNAKVHVFGDSMTGHPSFKNGWSHYLGKQSNVTIHPGVSYSEGLQILRKSKICLNSIPCFRFGSHERVLNGLGSGALPITSTSTFWDDNFEVGKDLLVYQSGKWEEVNDQVMDLLSNEHKRKTMVQNGRRKVMQDHTWDRRVEQLLEALQPILEKMKSGSAKK